ncbi:MAG TPA: hypothetical protein VIM17_03265 [Jatrophihabitantaceae bacterium]
MPADPVAQGLLSRRNEIACVLGAMRAAGTVDEARVGRLRSAKGDLDAELDRLVGPERPPMSLLDLLAL